MNLTAMPPGEMSAASCRLHRLSGPTGDNRKQNGVADASSRMGRKPRGSYEFSKFVSDKLVRNTKLAEQTRRVKELERRRNALKIKRMVICGDEVSAKRPADDCYSASDSRPCDNWCSHEECDVIQKDNGQVSVAACLRPVDRRDQISFLHTSATTHW